MLPCVDAVHSLSDIIADAMTVLTVKKSRQDPNDLYPFSFILLFYIIRYGHGKVEALGAMGIACFLIGTAGMIGWDSYLALKDILVNEVVKDYAFSSNILTYLVTLLILINFPEWSWCIDIFNYC